MENNIISYNTLTLENELKYNNETLLTYKIEYPIFYSTIYKKSVNKINIYYKNLALEYQNYLEKILFTQAVEQYKDSVANNYPVRVFEALLVYTVTYNINCILSLYFDKYEYTGGAHGNTTRYSQTWNLKTGSEIKLNELFICNLDYKAYILRQVKDQIENEPEIYFENYEQLIKDTFKEKNFYCTPDGIVVYYQQYDIAPYASGIREFLIPYDECFVNPETKCTT